MRRLARPLAVLLAVCALALVAAAPAGARTRTSAATAYLVGQLQGGTHLTSRGTANYGGTADLAVALAATGQHRPVLQRVVGYLMHHVDEYVDPNGTSSFPGPFTGSAGKLAVLAEVTGNNPRDVGGFDLLRVLTGNVCAAAKGGQYGPCSAKGDFYQVYSTVGQALAVLALARGGAPVPSAALARLESLQCADGGFSSTLLTKASKCTSDVDTTGYAIEALALIPSAKHDVARAAAFLRSKQQADGGWVGAAGENTNSTALAVQGLLAARTPKTAPVVRHGLASLSQWQNSDGGFGISAKSTKSDALATNQVVAATSLTTLSTLHRAVPVGAPARTGLASTGAPTGTLLAVGLGLVGAGGVALLAARRRCR